MKVKKPALVVDKSKVLRNIRRMMDKVTASGGSIRFRPHFKTHQSVETGEWLRELGVTSITVSSVDMAIYFALQGWKDITIGILLNPFQLPDLKNIDHSVALHLLVDTKDAVIQLDRELDREVNVWLKIDTGYHRSGIEWHNRGEILATAKAIEPIEKLNFKGVFTHSGHSYDAQSTAEIKQVYHDTVTKLQYIRDFLAQKGIQPVEISIGDTPTASVMEKFYGIDELRCGNFVYYDLMQMQLGSCREEEIAAAVACPVIGRYPQRDEIVIYGGAIHISKESVTLEGGQKAYGLVAMPDELLQHWGPALKHTYVTSLTQEHGIIKTPHEMLNRIKVGDTVMILPVHSCLTANLLK
jgi:D-serine deaminase-like pyridoxal phosphate-dependent protein